MPTNAQRELAAGLRPNEDGPYHGSFADMVIPNTDVTGKIIQNINSRDNRGLNFTDLMDAGWSGKHCIGTIKVVKAIELARAGQPFPCGKLIPLDRRQAVEDVYRCAECQIKKEEEDNKR